MILESIKKNKTGIILMIISSFCVCLGQLFWKLSIQHGFFCILIGFTLYGLGAILMIIAYKYGSLSVLQPILSLNYIFAIILAAIILNENITFCKIIGILIIITSVISIGGGDD